MKKLIALICLLPAVVSAALSPGLAPDLVLHGGNIRTVDKDDNVAEAMAIKGDRIAMVGTDRDVLETVGPDTRVIDLAGRTVIPGIIDSHIHAFGYGMHITRHVMFSTGEQLTVQGMLKEIAERAESLEPGEWIYARGPYSLDFVAERRLPTRDELDTVTPENPFFMNMQGHVGVVNSRAIELSGVTGDTPNPENGIYVRNPETGDLTGVLYEFPAFGPFLRHMPAYSREDRLNAVRAANDRFLSYGISGVVNLWTSVEEQNVLEQLAKMDELSVRWTTMLKVEPDNFANRTEAAVEAKLRDLVSEKEYADDWLKLGGIKIILDGFAEAAHMHDPYLEDMFGEGWTGVSFWDRDTLRSVLAAASRLGIQVSIHVAGDAAMDMALEAMDRIDVNYPISGQRWTLEHAGVMPTAKNLRTTSRLGVVISTQQSMGWSIGKTFKEYWGADKGATFAPNRTWLDHLGHPFLKAGSDNRPVNPFTGFWAYAARKDVDGTVGKPDEVLDRSDILRLYTVNGAYGVFDESLRGTIEAGKLADVVVLSDDVMTVDTHEIRSIRPLMTIVGGDIRYQAPE